MLENRVLSIDEIPDILDDPWNPVVVFTVNLEGKPYEIPETRIFGIINRLNIYPAHRTLLSAKGHYGSPSGSADNTRKGAQ